MPKYQEGDVIRYRPLQTIFRSYTERTGTILRVRPSDAPWTYEVTDSKEPETGEWNINEHEIMGLIQ